MGVMALDREVVANGSSYWSSLDWEVESIDAFIEASEGTLGDIFQIAREKLPPHSHWDSHGTSICARMVISTEMPMRMWPPEKSESTQTITQYTM
jgi:hypothetical protein